MEKRKYTFWQKLIAAICNVNVEWFYVTRVERLVMTFNSLSEDEKREFIDKITNK